jgi:hypothetical protein
MLPKRLLRRFSVDELRAAIRQKGNLDKVTALERKRDKLQKTLSRIERKLARLNGGNGAATTAGKPGRKSGRRKGYKLSAATRNRMRIAALKRYGNKGKVEAPLSGKRKRKPMSAATKAKMAEAARKRWAKIRGAKAEPKAAAE